jgi:hypothetical protein
MLQMIDRCTVTVQPAGSAGQRHVFLTLSGDGEKRKEIHIDLVISERAANDLSDALLSGAKGIMRELKL